MLKSLVEASPITLRPYHHGHHQALQSFYLTPSQLKFTALPKDVIELAIQDPYRFPVVIQHGRTPVGFFILHYGPEIKGYTANPRAILLRALSINLKDQGKGYATDAFRALRPFLQEYFCEFDEIVLAVNKGNHRAIHLYEKIGFHYKGKERFGFLGLKYYLHFSLPINENRAIR
ncbi:GNAT family N-acetyltransferase [Bacillus sp. PS06]|uniref:GNAT family N-acetyltransferase n=1 Tax=Bacillus sp. PS06 TaxID=2764176 RepID=UPI0017844C2E|nr:GNAT family protein [Bacillus sp. PS06]MBD8070082.1 GNAT family N-acetyltransferase [Bacillus sp. PS06]